MRGIFVEYKNFSKYTGFKTFFEKDLKFKDQKEYRLWIDYRREEDLNICIGNIEDISYLLPISELRNKVAIRVDNSLKIDSIQTTANPVRKIRISFDSQ